MSEFLNWLAGSGLLQPLPQEAITNYLLPQVATIAAVLVLIGGFLKKSKKVKDEYIPIVLWVFSLGMCAALLYSTADWVTIVYQSFIAAAVAVYGNQSVKQLGKKSKGK